MTSKSMSGMPSPDKDPKTMGPAELILDRGYQMGILKIMPMSLDDLDKPLSHAQIQGFPPIFGGNQEHTEECSRKAA